MRVAAFARMRHPDRLDPVTPAPDARPTEVPDTAVDVVPHDIVGYLAMGIVGVAMAMFWAYLASGVALALMVGAVIGGYAIVRLSRRAHRERQEEASRPGPHEPLT